jgi:DNA-directed RNA polymerase specialized sigma24 family protein
MGMTGVSIAEIENLYRDRFRTFLSVAIAVVGDPDAGFDAVQDAFASAIRARARYRGEGPLEAWIWRIVLNSALDSARRLRRASVPVLDPLAANGDEPTSPPAWLLELTDRQRTVVFLRYYADLDYATIAALLGISEGTVAATLNRAHAALRPHLEEERA